MTDATTGPSDIRERPFWLTTGVSVIAVALGTMWMVEILDTVALDDRLESHGIQPRSIAGLDGILWAPFLHGGFAHLISNTIPFVLLSALALAKGVVRYVSASTVIIVLGGLLVWLLAIGGNETHIGASGWIFGLFGYLVATAWYERRPVSILLAVVAVVLYGSTILFGFLPRPGLSWEGHLFGFVAGIAAARLFTPRKKPVTGELGGPVEMSG